MLSKLARSAVSSSHVWRRIAAPNRASLASFVSVTLPLYDKKVVALPSLGDSISEGAIVEWTIQVGQAVKAEDVVALVETDKVTVEIKAEMDGVVSQHFAAV
jgi:biotin carboxyl carrier protein